MLHLHLFFFLGKRAISQGVFVIGHMIWAGLSRFRVNFYKVYRIIYC